MPQPFPPRSVDPGDGASASDFWRALSGSSSLTCGAARPVARRISSFRVSLAFALEGLREAFATQRNLRIHTVFGAAALACAVVLRLPVHDLALVVALTALVLFAELMNTAIEATLDHAAGPAFDPSIKLIKDLAAAAVLVAALGATIIGLVVFLPAVPPLLRGEHALSIPRLAISLALMGMVLGAVASLTPRRASRALRRRRPGVVTAGAALLALALIAAVRLFH